MDFIPSNFDTSKFLVAPTGLCTTYPTPSEGDEGKMRFDAAFSHLNYDCPIAKQDVPGSMPLMMWMGNPGGNAYSTYASLRAGNDSTCQGRGINLSAYYGFAMIDKAKNKVIKPSCAVFYYSINRRDLKPFTSPNAAYGTSKAAQMIPVGLRMIFGKKSTETVPWPVWYSDDDKWSGTQVGTIAEVADKIGTGGTGRLIMRISAPNCWDGVNLDSPDHRSHLAYMEQDGYGNAVCPPTHPVPIPTITWLCYWETAGEDIRNWALSADIDRGLPGGTSARGFYMEAWDRPILEEKAGKAIMGIGASPNSAGVVDIKTGVQGQLCTDTQEGLCMPAQPIYINPNTQPLSERYMDIPPKPVTGTPTSPPPPPIVTSPPPPPPAPAPVYSWQAYKSGKTTMYKILEGGTLRINSISLAECRWLCGVLKIKAP